MSRTRLTALILALTVSAVAIFAAGCGGSDEHHRRKAAAAKS